MKKFTVYISKYALTKGIIKKEVREVSATHVAGVGLLEHYHKPEWHDSLQSAQAEAEKMRIKKIESLKNQLTKLENLKF